MVNIHIVATPDIRIPSYTGKPAKSHEIGTVYSLPSHPRYDIYDITPI